MPKKAKELSALAVNRLAKKGLHPVGGVPGLRLQITESGAKSWILRVLIEGRRHEIGLGPLSAISLAAARDKAKEMQEQIKEGMHPLQARKEKRLAALAARASQKTFKEAAKEYIASKKDGWKNKKHIKQWEKTLETYAYPTIGDLHVKDIGLPHITNILEPIWKNKTETATRLRGRIERILAWATVRGFRSGENPARWKGFLEEQLAPPNKLAKVVHHKALPANEVAEFIKELRTMEGTGKSALEFLILTATRSGEVRGTTWSEIDMKAKTWTIPASRMKAGKEHRVPLSPPALKILKEVAQTRFEGVDFVFPGERGGMLSDMTLSAVMRRMKVKAVPHGFRSTFRDWVAEKTDYPDTVAEMALAHTISSQVIAAYKRGDLFEKRRLMMRDWANFCCKAPN